MNEEDYKTIIRLLRKQNLLLLDLISNFGLDKSTIEQNLKISDLIEQIITANYVGDDDASVEEMLS